MSQNQNTPSTHATTAAALLAVPAQWQKANQASLAENKRLFDLGLKTRNIPPPQKKCPRCDRAPGIAILPVRYALACNRKTLNASGDIDKNMLPDLPAIHGNFQIGDPALNVPAERPDVVYTLRLLRRGYLYVWMEHLKAWQAWQVGPDGALWAFNATDETPAVYSERERFNCAISNGHLHYSRFITIPQPASATDIYMGWSASRWSRQQLQEMQQQRAAHLTKINVKSAALHSAAIDQLSTTVAEFAVSPTHFFEHYRDFANPPQRPERQMRHPDEFSNTENVLPSYYGGYAAGLLATMMQKVAASANAAALIAACDDPLGITQDLACLAQPTQYGHQPPVRDYWTDVSLNQIETALIDKNYNAMLKRLPVLLNQSIPAKRQQIDINLEQMGNTSGALTRHAQDLQTLQKAMDAVLTEPSPGYAKQWLAVAEGIVGQRWPARAVFDAQAAVAPLHYDIKSYRLPSNTQWMTRAPVNPQTDAFVKQYADRHAAFQAVRATARQKRSESSVKNYQPVFTLLSPLYTLHARWLESPRLAKFMDSRFEAGNAEHGRTYDAELARCLLAASDNAATQAVVTAWINSASAGDRNNLLVQAMTWRMASQTSTSLDNLLRAYAEQSRLAKALSPGDPNNIDKLKQWMNKADVGKDLRAIWAVMAAALARYYPNLPKNVPEALEKLGFFPQTFTLVLPQLLQAHVQDNRRASALVLTMMSLINNKTYVAAPVSEAARMAQYLATLAAQNPSLYEQAQHDPNLRGTLLAANEVAYLKAQVIPVYKGAPPPVSKPALILVAHEADYLATVDANSQQAIVQARQMQYTDIRQGRFVITPRALLSGGGFATFSSSVLSLLFLYNGLDKFKDEPEVHKNRALTSLVAMGIGAAGSVSASVGRTMQLVGGWRSVAEVNSLRGAATAAQGGAAEAVVELPAKAKSMWPGWMTKGSALCRLGGNLSIVAGGVSGAVMLSKAWQFFEDGDRVKGIVFGVAGGAAVLAFVLSAGVWFTLLSAAAMAPVISVLLGVAVIGGIIAAIIDDSALKTWAKESCFGTSHTQRQHLRDDILSFNALDVAKGGA